MHDKRFQKLVARLDAMSDLELFAELERFGVVVEDIPQGADPNVLIVEDIAMQVYVSNSRPSNTWTVSGDTLFAEDLLTPCGRDNIAPSDSSLVDWYKAQISIHVDDLPRVSKLKYADDHCSLQTTRNYGEAA